MQPVIICSAAILDDHITELHAMQVEQFLTKPYHPLDLLDRIAGEIGQSLCLERNPARGRDPLHEPVNRQRPFSNRPVRSPGQAAAFGLESSACRAKFSLILVKAERSWTESYKPHRLAREGRFHGWETAESTRPQASEGSRRTARSDGR